MGVPNREIYTKAEWKRLARELRLPPRQMQITRHIMRGCGDKQIAEALGISVATVRTHLGRLFKRLEVDDRCELILHVVDRMRVLNGRRSARP